jgi:predicted permease
MKWSRILLWLSVLGLVTTGVALHLLTPEDEWAMPHPLNGALRMAHGWFMLLALLVFGAFLGEHVSRKWRKVAKHPDGVVHLIIWFGLIISGEFLYYPIDSLSAFITMKTVHWYLGLGLIGLFIFHLGRYHLGKKTSAKSRMR